MEIFSLTSRKSPFSNDNALLLSSQVPLLFCEEHVSKLRRNQGVFFRRGRPSVSPPSTETDEARCDEAQGTPRRLHKTLRGWRDAPRASEAPAWETHPLHRQPLTVAPTCCLGRNHCTCTQSPRDGRRLDLSSCSGDSSNGQKPGDLHAAGGAASRRPAGATGLGQASTSDEF